MSALEVVIAHPRRTQPPVQLPTEPPAREPSVGEGFSIEKDPGGKEDAAPLGQGLTGRRIEILAWASVRQCP